MVDLGSSQDLVTLIIHVCDLCCHIGQSPQCFYRVFGYLLLFLATAELLTAAVSAWFAERTIWAFLLSSIITAAVGGSLLYLAGQEIRLIKRNLFLVTALGWVLFSAFATIPLYLALDGISRVDAWFEAVSAVTTTGSTILSDIESLPKGVLFWRAFLQWFGGIGIIAMAVAEGSSGSGFSARSVHRSAGADTLPDCARQGLV
ncbi:potassium transporter TrkG [Alkalimonas mucilaginosa]|uniref:Potassium transporter TrkG n=1 Tax=Alkalimonas mucilaginosa TaxID=3057676 RepID=A0ABU7JIV7_9GAMM|nr:potassium transporter TrkG [Alkalimonas sp. MEB004]MEE2025605.1 potassium transporter TrkG [Alkalimonas sp. MEB004]